MHVWEFFFIARVKKNIQYTNQPLYRLVEIDNVRKTQGLNCKVPAISN